MYALTHADLRQKKWSVLLRFFGRKPLALVSKNVNSTLLTKATNEIVIMLFRHKYLQFMSI